MAESEFSDRAHLAEWIKVDTIITIATEMDARGMNYGHVAAWAVGCVLRVQLEPIEEFTARFTPFRPAEGADDDAPRRQ